MNPADELTEMNDPVDAAFREAAETVVLRAHAGGAKIVLWIDGRVALVDPWETDVGKQMIAEGKGPRPLSPA